MSAPPRRRPGRRPIADEAATANVNLRVTPAQWLELRRVAEENHTDVAGVVREAIDDYVSDYREQRIFRRPRNI